MRIHSLSFIHLFTQNIKTMKATKFFALALAGIALAWGGVGCSSDDEPSVNEKTTLSTPAPQASDITTSSFVATWPAVTGAGSYVYTVNNGAEQSVSATSVKVEGLTANTAYAFKVKAVPANTADFEESAWGSVNVTTKEETVIPDIGEISFNYVVAEEYGWGAWTIDGAPTDDAYNYMVYLYNINMEAGTLNYQLLLDIQAAGASLAGNYTINDSFDPNTIIVGFIQEGNLLGSWLAFPDETGESLDMVQLTALDSGTINIAQNGENYTVAINAVGIYNLIAESESDIKTRNIATTYEGPIEIEATEEAGLQSIKKTGMTDYRKFDFVNFNRVADKIARKAR